MWRAGLSLLLIFISLAESAVLDPKDEHHFDHRKLKSRPLSDSAHDHDAGDVDYDHDAFLGEELSSQFDMLSPEESQRRLGMIVDRIDSDLNGLISQEELEMWISSVQEREIREDTERQWQERVPEGGDRITWPEYRKSSYGTFDEQEDGKNGFDFSSMIKRDRRRFLKADRNNDRALDKEEFQNFLHPEDAVHLRDVVVLETMEDMDTDGDGKISVTEYLADMWQGEPGEEPDWVKEERDEFFQNRDKDGDGLLEFNEVKDWIVPEDFDHSTAEAHHLIVTVDENQDNFLTKEEILNRYDVFVGSQATQFGEILNRHEEF